MNFKKRWCTSTITSNDGYAVTFRGRSQIIYQEAALRVFIDAERTHLKRYGWVFSKRDMFLHGGKRLDDTKLQKKIADRIAAVCEHLELDALID